MLQKRRFEKTEGFKTVTCYTHQISAFINAAINQGLQLIKMCEHFDEEDKLVYPEYLPYCLKKKEILKILFTLLLFGIALYGCKTSHEMKNVSNINVHAIRLKPKEDLRKAIEDYAKQNNIVAGWMVTCVGSLTNYNIRFANEEKGTSGMGHFEIVSLVGTVSKNGCHIHISISDSTGRTIGGHLLAGCTVYTTAEIVMQSTPDLIFKREKDGSTPWEELQIERVK